MPLQDYRGYKAVDSGDGYVEHIELHPANASEVNKLPDISYGTYIYAFPVQQGLMATLPSLPLGQYMAYSLFMTWILAYLSWILIEKRSLALKDAIARHLTNG